MKPAALTGLLLLIAATAGAQFTLLPQLGFDRTKTCLNSNNIGFYAPAGAKTFMKGAVRLDYRFKGGHGPFAAIATSPGVLENSIPSASSISSNYKVSAGSLQWRVEAGYQYRSNPIQFKSAPSKKVEQQATKKTTERNNCASYCHRSCGSQKKTAPAKQNLNMRLLPSLGIAWLPSVKNDFSPNGNSYQYNAGNWKTGLVSGMGFEFGKGKERILTLSVLYTKGLTNLGTKTITREENSKPVTTSFRSRSYSWGLTIGVPFSLVKNKKPAAKATEQKKLTEQKKDTRTRCEYYYKSRCIRQI